MASRLLQTCHNRSATNLCWAAKSAGNELSLKTIAALRANAEANFSYSEALVDAKLLSEVVELQTAFLRKRIELTVEQATEFLAVLRPNQ